jgi:hypothetical protein
MTDPRGRMFVRFPKADAAHSHREFIASSSILMTSLIGGPVLIGDGPPRLISPSV